MVNIKIPTLLFILSFVTAFADEPPIGQWRDHLNYSNAISITEGGGKVYCASKMGLFSYNKSDESLERWSKITGLSDIGFQSIAYNKSSNALLIAYSNSNIDIIKGQDIYNLADLFRSNVMGDKQIYSISFRDEFAYLATGFGIVVVDMKKTEIKGSYFYGPSGNPIKTNKVINDGTYIYAATDNGIYQAEVNSPNLADFNSWNKRSDLPDKNAAYKSMALLNDILVIVKTGQVDNNDSVFFYRSNAWNYLNKGENNTVNSIETHNDLLLLTYYESAASFELNGSRKFFIGDYFTGISPHPNSMVADDQDIYWIADLRQGLIKAKDAGTFALIHPKGPASNNVHHLASNKNNIWVAPGGKSSSWGSLFNHDAISVLSEQDWKIIQAYHPDGGNLFDMLHISIHPKNNQQAYISSWGKGLVEITDFLITELYSLTNSTLENDFRNPNVDRITVASSAFDKENNLWVTNSAATKPLSVRRSDGSWKSFTIPGLAGNTVLGTIIVAQNNYKWITLPAGEGIVVYDDNNTLDDESDDRAVILTSTEGKGGLPSNMVLSIAEDHDGKIWIGTVEGTAVFYNPGAVFNEENFDAQQVKVEQGGNIQFLLQNQTVSSIAIDGANRKWFGTEDGGAFLMSAEGTQQIEAFNVNNSPLFSNNIISIAITDNGEVFFGTENGIVSYRSTASAGGQNYINVYAYPNPVHHDYEGLIAIRGLVKDADIKITDISGNLVYETTALGGQAVWDGRTLRGDKAHTGVYLVFCSNTDGSKTIVTKILIIN